MFESQPVIPAAGGIEIELIRTSDDARHADDTLLQGSEPVAGIISREADGFTRRKLQTPNIKSRA
jgi:hypothetical protein